MSHSSSERRRGPNALYMEKVRYLQERLQDEENVEKVIAGFDKVAVYGNYNLDEFDVKKADRLIIVGRKHD